MTVVSRTPPPHFCPITMIGDYTWHTSCRDRKASMSSTKSVISRPLPTALLRLLRCAVSLSAWMDFSDDLAQLCCQLLPWARTFLCRSFKRCRVSRNSTRLHGQVGSVLLCTLGRWRYTSEVKLVIQKSGC